MDVQVQLDKNITSRLAWLVFSVGAALPVVGWVYWMVRVGPSWWFAYRDAEPHHLSTGDAAERVRLFFMVLGVLFCAAAPLFAGVPLKRKLFLSGLAAILAAVVYYLSGWVVMYGFLGA